MSLDDVRATAWTAGGGAPGSMAGAWSETMAMKIRHYLPQGFESEDDLLRIKAGRAYAHDRWEDADQVGIIDPEPFETYEVDPPHPECRVHLYRDGSALVISNAVDEVWADFTDYLGSFGGRVERGAIHGLDAS